MAQTNQKSWRDFERSSGYQHIEVLPLNGAVAAEVKGADLTKPLPDEVWREIERAFAENLVIYFRDQQGFSRDDHLAFAQRFGPLQKIPHIFSVDDYPDVQIVERLADDKRMVVGEGFHNDSTFMATPPTTVTMHAIDVPEFGGDTAFANLYLAYETLSPAMQDFCETLIGVNSATALFGSGAGRKNVMMKDMKTEEGDNEVEHPIVGVHPRTGLKHLFFNLVYTRRLKGFSEKESRLILDFLHHHVTSMAFTGRVRWENGTVLIWDNWAAHHSAIADYPGKYRYMERVTTGGLKPAGGR
ncbi:TauD/TfdA dioxygenase family protein [Marinicaulis aureus]|uniref:TauD/TfdA dioxygenase family protein n=1 Tax=Hyphococcus aureus TaxID=2666033 RepID=A0ABW1KUX7_9PROT